VSFKITICDVEAMPEDKHSPYAFREDGAIMAVDVLDSLQTIV
jgi:hypothetical protein